MRCPACRRSRQPARSPIGENMPGHGCGHNLLGTGSLAAAVAVKEWLAAGRSGTLRYYGTPAEEGGSGKVYMVRAGLFKDVDAVVAWHPGDRNDASPSSNLANITGKFRFQRRRGARGGGAGPRAFGAGRGRGDELHGEHDARARAAGDAHPLHHHARRRGAERRARFRGGVLLRAPAGHADSRRRLGTHRQRRQRRGARYRNDDGARGDRARSGTCCRTNICPASCTGTSNGSAGSRTRPRSRSSPRRFERR